MTWVHRTRTLGTPRADVEVALRKAYPPAEVRPRKAHDKPKPPVADADESVHDDPKSSPANPPVQVPAELESSADETPGAPPTIESKPTPIPPSRPAPGRGGKQHQYLQQLIKGWGEQAGYKSTVEAPTPSGDGAVDVLLAKDSQSIAVEVSSTTSAGHELQNVRKCLAASYDLVAAVSPHARKTNALRKLAKVELSAAELRTVRFWSPDELLAHLAGSPPAACAKRWPFVNPAPNCFGVDQPRWLHVGAQLHTRDPVQHSL